MSDIEIIKNYGSIENYIYELEQKNKELKEGNTIYNQFVNYKNWYFDYVDKYENLQQENQQLKEQMAEIVKYKELESCSTATQYMAKANVYKVYDTHIKKLKETNDKLYQQLDLYKEVIEEVKEVIRDSHVEVLKYHDEPSETTSYEIVTVELLQILDKVKEN